MSGQHKSSRILYHQSYHLIEKPDTYQNYIEKCQEFFEKCQGIAFILQSYRYVAKEQPCLKSTGPYDDLLVLCSLFHFFLFHIQCSHLIQFMFSNFSISYFWCSFSSLYELFKISVSLMTWADTRWQLGTTPSFPYPRVPPVGTLPFRFCNGAM